MGRTSGYFPDDRETRLACHVRISFASLQTMERLFQRNVDSLKDVFIFVKTFSAEAGLGERTVFYLEFIIEELFTNMVKYNPRTTADIRVALERFRSELVVTIVDPDSERFDLMDAPPVDITQSLDERKIGGLGIHLVKTMADSVGYEYKDRQSKIVIRKKIEDTNVDR